jgi:hypothetical protein
MMRTQPIRRQLRQGNDDHFIPTLPIYGYNSLTHKKSTTKSKNSFVHPNPFSLTTQEVSMQPGSPMNPRTRWIIAVPLALVGLGIAAAVYPLGFFLGGMATDSCTRLPGYAFWYLEYLWPLIMGICAFISPILIVRKVRWRWVILAAVAGLGIGVIGYVLWFVILMFLC